MITTARSVDIHSEKIHVCTCILYECAINSGELLLSIDWIKSVSSENLLVFTGNIFPANFGFEGLVAVKMMVTHSN